MAMQKPIDVDIPHKLGRDEAHRHRQQYPQASTIFPAGRAIRRKLVGRAARSLIRAMGQAVEADRCPGEQGSLPHSAAGHAGSVRRPDRQMLKLKAATLLEDKRD
jgi:hypothetical protein